jgi:battenin
VAGLVMIVGASYVNIFYLLLHSDTIPQADKEPCVNIAAIAQTLGITFACIFNLIIMN